MSLTQEGQVRVVLVEEHRLVREGLVMLVDSWHGCRVVGVAGEAAEAVRVVGAERPDVVLFDLDPAGEEGLELIPELAEASADSHVIILTSIRDREAHLRAARLGAKGLVLKDKAGADLRKAVGRVCEGEVWFDRALLGKLFEGLRGGGAEEEAKIGRLTEAERGIIAAFGEGLTTTKEIAGRLAIEPSTVEKHLTSIYGKLGVQNRLSLVIFAYNRGLLKPLKPSPL